MAVLLKRGVVVFSFVSLIVSIIISLLLMAIVAYIAWRCYQKHQEREDEKHRAQLNASGLAQQGYTPNRGPMTWSNTPQHITTPAQQQQMGPATYPPLEKERTMTPTRKNRPQLADGKTMQSSTLTSASKW